MAFDMGFDYRATSTFVTDPAYGVPTLGEAYPHTYTNGNGDSINAGWTAGNLGQQNMASSNDARIAGDNYSAALTEEDFQVDLGSGSNPGAGDYSIDIAVGQPTNPTQNQFAILDNATTLITTSGTISVAANHFVDATLTDVTATTTWTGTPVTKTFATTTCIVKINLAGAVNNNGMLSHFRLTRQGATATATPPKMLMLLGVGS